MPAPKKVQLPPRKPNKQPGVSWGAWLGGIVIGVIATLIAQQIDYQQLLNDSGLDETSPTADNGKKEPDLLDRLPIEFYKLLPNQEEQVPVNEISKQIRETPPNQPTGRADQYRLQAGSFQKMEDADRRRASILILGLETHIQTVNHGGATWHRVMLGPFESLKHLEVARHRLAENKIETIVLKLKTG